ncbi:MAG TPA: endolytic transglycosylase MltG [Anaerolineaceae bacterium]|nr:endolytic transglycosylase MltG [Anaerolineaceae bacterium]
MSDKRKSIFPIFLLLVLLAIMAGMVFVTYQTRQVYGFPGASLNKLSILKNGLILFRGREAMQAFSSSDSLQEEKVTVEAGQPIQKLCSNLEAQQLVPSGSLTCAYLVYSGKDRNIQPGNYTIPSGLNAIEIADLVADVNRRDKQFVIYPGWRLEEVAEMVGGLGLPFGKEEFLAMAMNPSENLHAPLEIPQGKSLEGFLFPGAYSVKPDITLEGLIAEILTRFKTQVLTEEFRSNLGSCGLTLHEAVTMASIIQRETLAEEEMATIASVFYNRLAINMFLETDPTVQYAIGFNVSTETWWKSPLTYDDLEINSPYNTYRNPGLPPGPISNPDLAALKAAVAPADTDYLFFRAKCDGSATHNFSTTYEEHLNFGCE